MGKNTKTCGGGCSAETDALDPAGDSPRTKAERNDKATFRVLGVEGLEFRGLGV